MEYDSTLLIVAILITIILARRIIRNVHGAKYSLGSVFITPAIYIILTAFFVEGLFVWQIFVLIASVLVGIGAGLLFGRRSDIFEKNGQVMYRRSNEVMILWIVAFVIRIGADFFYNPSISSLVSGAALNSTVSAALVAYEASPIAFGADILLALSAGLLLGEAIILYRKHSSRYGHRDRGQNSKIS